MKIKFVLLVALILLIPINVDALEYKSTLSGKDTIYSKKNTYWQALYSNLYVDITNIENIGYFEMYVSYDKNLIGLNNCNLFNYAGSGCHMSSSKIYYKYEYSDSYEKYFNNNSFYRIVFVSNDSTPSSGTMKVDVYFENAKDKEQNPITITSSSKTYTFSESKINVPTTEEDTSNNKDESNNQAIGDDKENTSTNENNNYVESQNDTSGNNSINNKDNGINNNEIENNESNGNSIKETKEDKTGTKTDDENHNVSSEKQEPHEKNHNYKYLIIVGITLGVIIIGIVLIVTYKNNKKLDKMFDEL